MTFQVPYQCYSKNQLSNEIKWFTYKEDHRAHCSRFLCQWSDWNLLSQYFSRCLNRVVQKMVFLRETVQSNSILKMKNIITYMLGNTEWQFLKSFNFILTNVYIYILFRNSVHFFSLWSCFVVINCIYICIKEHCSKLARNW